MTKKPDRAELSENDLDAVQGGGSDPYKGTDIFASEGGLGTTRKTPTGKGDEPAPIRGGKSIVKTGGGSGI